MVELPLSGHVAFKGYPGSIDVAVKLHTVAGIVRRSDTSSHVAEWYACSAKIFGNNG